MGFSLHQRSSSGPEDVVVVTRDEVEEERSGTKGVGRWWTKGRKGRGARQREQNLRICIYISELVWRGTWPIAGDR